mgnify:FL=1
MSNKEKMATDYTDRTDKPILHHELTEEIIGVFYDVYNELGHGFLESVYETAMAIALNKKTCESSNRSRFQCGFAAS